MLKSIEIHDIPRHSTTSSASSYQPSSHSLAATKNLHRRTWEAQEMNLTGSGMAYEAKSNTPETVCSIGTLIWNLVCSFVFRHGYHHRPLAPFGAQRPPMFDLFAGRRPKNHSVALDTLAGCQAFQRRRLFTGPVHAKNLHLPHTSYCKAAEKSLRNGGANCQCPEIAANYIPIYPLVN